MFYYRFLVFCLALRVEAGAFQWTPSCDEPWTGAAWREALQKAASAALNRDPSYVIYFFIKSKNLIVNFKVILRFTDPPNKLIHKICPTELNIALRELTTPQKNY